MITPTYKVIAIMKENKERVDLALFLTEEEAIEFKNNFDNTYGDKAFTVILIKNEDIDLPTEGEKNEEDTL